jgi:hypothetical protein
VWPLFTRVLKSHIRFRYYAERISLAKKRYRNLTYMCVLFICKRNLLPDNQTLVVTCKHIQKNVHEDANTDKYISLVYINKPYILASLEFLPGQVKFWWSENGEMMFCVKSSKYGCLTIKQSVKHTQNIYTSNALDHIYKRLWLQTCSPVWS